MPVCMYVSIFMYVLVLGQLYILWYMGNGDGGGVRTLCGQNGEIIFLVSIDMKKY